jgi:ABC-type nickel/cobalt efflux system permease component RcnA
MDYGLVLIFWYGVLHAFGPDHLTAIADFSIGKDKARTMAVTLMFAVGHGLSLFVFAKILTYVPLSESILAYGDIISSSVIIAMGLYLLFMASTKRIHLGKHMHEGKEHIHIWFGSEHRHDDGAAKASAATMGLLMGAGGVRGMLVTLGAVGSGNVDMTMVAAFTAGVMLVFGAFGLVLAYINEHLLDNVTTVRRAFGFAGAVSLVVGANMLLG